ncbi:uncharacterized protein LOC117789253 [Drosophila innubila]|uniref:uncharacterized protein LOC117789253 n=1 Tax=Drosophila innubila TaxID=198719 RepID=UPI00148B49F9|nr:uncharacterized protein LOC117789253 [Drosophila innubila]
MFKSYQLAVAVALLFVCFNPEVTSFARNLNHHRPNVTYGVPAHNYHPGYNQSRPAVQQPNIGFYNHVSLNQPQPNFGFGFNPQPVYNGNPQPVYGGNGYRPANLTAVQGGYRPHNSTSVFGKLFKLW